MKTIKIFLASSSELAHERAEFIKYIQHRNSVFQESSRNLFLDLKIWEHFIDAISKTGLQSEYNKTIENCDIFVMMFFTKVGKYTLEEFDTAFGKFKESGKPQIFVYFKNASVNIGEIKRSEINSMWDFKDKLEVLKHYKTDFITNSDLEMHFTNQLDRLFPQETIPGMFSKIEKSILSTLEDNKSISIDELSDLTGYAKAPLWLAIQSLQIRNIIRRINDVQPKRWALTNASNRMDGRRP